MTVSTTNSVTRHLGNGVTRDFPTKFPFGDLTDVGVKLLTELGAEVDLVYGEDYTVTGGEGATGSVNLTVAPSSLEQIAVYRKTPQTQETDYGSGDPFPSASHERALDKITYTVQELQAEVNRSIKVQVTSDTTPDQLIEQLTSDAADAKQAALDSKTEADRSKTEADRSKTEADRSKTEADRSKTEADRSKTEADRAYGIVESAKELFEIKPHNGPLDSIQVGFIPGIGQTWFAATYPDAAAGLEAGKQFMVSELLWQTGVSGNPDAYKGCWSSGGTDEQGRRWYRAPKLNRDGTYRAPFLRGSEIGVDAGQITDDRIRNITGSMSLGSASTFLLDESNVVGAFKRGAQRSNRLAAAVSGVAYDIELDASLVVPTGPENSPRYHGVIMCIRMFGTVSNPGSVDAAQLATDLGVANAKIAALETKGQLSATGSATLIGVDNTIEFSNIVNECGLEKGDVIRLVFSGYDKLHTVESLINSNKVCVNYEHCGGRGNGSLKLPDGTGVVTITRIAKWYNAPLGLGQAHVKVTSLRTVGLDYPNSTGRAILISCPQSYSAGQQSQIKIDGVTYVQMSSRGDAAWAGYAGTLITANSDYGVPTGGGRAIIEWTEIR